MGGSTVKFIVDEMPFFESDCPFCDDEVCTLDNTGCERMSKSTKVRGTETECRWLKEEKK